jgi:serine/threonine protein kinase
MKSLGAYTLLDRIASGPSSEIYIAADTKNPRAPVYRAVKLIRPRLARDAAFIDALLKDAPIATRFRHKTAVEIYDVFSADGEALIVEQFVKGRTLAELLEVSERERMPIAREVLLWIGVQLAELLGAMHKLRWSTFDPEPLWHGAISPYDILIDGTGRLYVLGCGLGRARNATPPALDRLPYAAPETLDGGRSSTLSDIYGLGLTLYDALAGGHLFRRATVAETRAAILRGEFERLAQRTAYPNAIVDELLFQSMSQSPGSRPQNVSYVERALRSQVRASDELMASRLAEHVRRAFSQELEGLQRALESARRKQEPEEIVEHDTLEMGRQVLAPSNDLDFGGITEPMKKLEPPPQLEAEEDLLKPADLLADLFDSIEVEVEVDVNEDVEEEMGKPTRTQPVAIVRPASVPRAPSITAAKKVPPPRRASLIGSGAADVAGAPVPFQQKIAAVLVRYELGAEIAKLGPIAGIEARLRETRAPVLIRGIDLDRTDDARLSREEWLACFEREAAIARRANHPLLPKLLESGAQGALRFAIFDHAEGAPLSLVIGRGKQLAADPVRKIIASMALALHHLHERATVFANVQASSVWLTREGHGRLFDLSMAAPFGGPLHTLLPANIFALSPEFLRDGEYGPASDQFALGALLYELLTQTRPFRGLDTEMIVAAIRDRDPLAPFNLDSRVDPQLSRVAMRALDKDPGRRFGSCAELARALTGQI